jgi:dTDP-4-dehydrorhamnose reductase
MKVLVTGGSGRLGKALVRMFPECLHPSRRELDLTAKLQVKNFIRIEKPDVLIHAAAVTNVQRCEDVKCEAYDTNVVGTETLVRSCLAHDPECYFVLVSTACVFRGNVGGYTETDLPYPTNYYGLSKLLAECVVKYSGLKSLIVRTNFVAREQWHYPKAFVDRFGTYLFASDVASAIKKVTNRKLTGLVHVCGSEKMSMFELAKITTPNIEPMTLADYHGVPLTVDMSLTSRRLNPFKISR